MAADLNSGETVLVKRCYERLMPVVARTSVVSSSLHPLAQVVVAGFPMPSGIPSGDSGTGPAHCRPIERQKRALAPFVRRRSLDDLAVFGGAGLFFAPLDEDLHRFHLRRIASVLYSRPDHAQLAAVRDVRKDGRRLLVIDELDKNRLPCLMEDDAVL